MARRPRQVDPFSLGVIHPRRLVEQSQIAYRHWRSSPEGYKARWFELALRMVASIPYGYEFTAEDARLWMEACGFAPPLHHNSWGMLIKQALGRRLMYHTGHRRRMIGPRAHGRSTDIYRRDSTRL